MVLPVLGAVVSLVATWRFRSTVGDTAWLTQRVADVVEGRWPLVGMPSSIGRGDLATHHPGPIEFYWLAPWWWLGGFRGVTLGSAASGVLALTWLGVAVRGLPGGSLGVALGSQTAALVGLLTVGPDILADPWNPYLALPWALVVLAGVVEIVSGRTRGWLTFVVAGSIVAQLHAGYLPWVGAFAVAVLVVGWRAPGTRPDRRWGWWSAGAFLALWALPVIDLVADTRNPWLLARAGTGGSVDAAGWRPVAVAAGTALRPVRAAMDGPWLTSDPRAVEVLVVVATAIVAALSWWFAARPARTWLAVTGLGVAVWAVLATRALPFQGLMPVAYTRLLWPLGSMLWFWVAAAWWARRPGWAAGATWLPPIVMAAWLLTVPRGYVGIDPAIRTRADQVVAALDGARLPDAADVTARGSLAGWWLAPTLTAELDRRGVRNGVGTDPTWDLEGMTARPVPLGVDCELVIGDEEPAGTVLVPRGDAPDDLVELRRRMATRFSSFAPSRLARAIGDDRIVGGLRGSAAREAIDSGRLADLVIEGRVEGVTLRDDLVADYVEATHLAEDASRDLTVWGRNC